MTIFVVTHKEYAFPAGGAMYLSGLESRSLTLREGFPMILKIISRSSTLLFVS